MIEISIRDTGVGMPKNMIEKLFKVGENIGRKGTEGELSTGLGLLLCKEFVDRNCGKIWVESEEGKGSTFSFTLQETGKATD
jgi:signal transduction histidine kinase